VTHEERVELARELTAALLRRHGEEAIVAVGAHGPVARGDDGDESGLDLAVITARPEVQVPDRLLRHRGVVVDLGAITADAYLEEAGHIGPAWPLAADQYVNHLALHDPGEFFHKLRHVHEAAVEQSPPAAFQAAAGYDLAQLAAWEARARHAELAGDLAVASLAVKEAAVLAMLVVGLHTRTAYPDLAGAVRATAATEVAGPGFPAAYRRLLDPTVEPAGQVLALGRVLDALQALARREGIPFESSDLEDFL
jgi:hypothetical protein